MAKMRLLVTFMSPGAKVPIREIGEVCDFPEADVAELVRSGLAEPVEGDIEKHDDEHRPTRKRAAK